MESLTSIPILRSSAWIRGLPHVGFELHMSRISFWTWGSILGRPPMDRLSRSPTGVRIDQRQDLLDRTVCFVQITKRDLRQDWRRTINWPRSWPIEQDPRAGMNTRYLELNRPGFSGDSVS